VEVNVVHHLMRHAAIVLEDVVVLSTSRLGQLLCDRLYHVNDCVLPRRSEVGHTRISSSESSGMSVNFAP